MPYVRFRITIRTYDQPVADLWGVQTGGAFSVTA